MRLVLLTLVGLAAAVVVSLSVAAARWRAGTGSLRRRLEAARVPIAPATLDPHELEGLPDPVRRYFGAVLAPGQPIIAAAHVRHAGTFDTGEDAERWARFTSDQRVITRRPGFDWDARVRMAPGVTAWVHDAYVAGEGILVVSAMALVPIVRLRGSPEVARGELMRFLAESPWYPTALLPSQGVRWEPVDDGSARATLADGEVGVTLTFRFDDEGLIESVHADARGRTVGGRVVQTPWEGRWSAYEIRDGMRVPTRGEVAWIAPSGRRPYWRGRITDIAYEYAPRGR